MKEKKSAGGYAALILIFMCFQFNQNLSAELPPFARAQEHFTATTLAWTALEDYDTAYLSISGPDGRVLRRQFNHGASLFLSLSELAGEFPLADGSYSYDLTFTSGQLVADDDPNPIENDDPLLSGPRVQTQIGGFRLLGGVILDKNIRESKTTNPDPLPVQSSENSGILTPMDVVLSNRDAIVQGALAVGTDCQSDENLDGVNMLLKENILRFSFDDTSSSSGFPNTDWQLSCNDSNTGGLNKFSIDNVSASRSAFTIKGSARSNALNLGLYGRVGLGTATPAYPLELRTSGEQADLVLNRTDGVTASVSATQYRMSIGTISNHPIRFQVNNSFAMDLSVRRYLGIGVINPQHPLQMASGAYCSRDGVWVNASSFSLKENIRPLNEKQAVETLEGLKTVRFNYRAEPEEEYLGFIAEEVPALVGSSGRDGMSAMDVLALLTHVVQKQQLRIQELRDRINSLSTELTAE